MTLTDYSRTSQLRSKQTYFTAERVKRRRKLYKSGIVKLEEAGNENKFTGCDGKG